MGIREEDMGNRVKQGLAVTNSTPLIALSRLDSLPLLDGVFEELVVAEEVLGEVSEGGLKLPDFISVRRTALPRPEALLKSQLDLGEESTIALALELSPKLVLIDELKGRKVATRLGLPVGGTLGFLVLLKQLGRIEEVRPLMDALVAQGFRVSEKVRKIILAAAHE